MEHALKAARRDRINSGYLSNFYLIQNGRPRVRHTQSSDIVVMLVWQSAVTFPRCSDREYKIVLVGEFGMGKSSLVSRFVVRGHTETHLAV